MAAANRTAGTARRNLIIGSNFQRAAVLASRPARKRH
jgi:hypothetical protein